MVQILSNQKVHFVLSGFRCDLKGEYFMFNQAEFETIINDALKIIGIKQTQIGYKFLLKAVEFVVKDDDLLYNLTTKLYPKLAEHFNVEDFEYVERVFYHLVENTFNNNNFVMINELFKTEIFSEYDRLTVGELIKVLSEYYHFQINF